MPSKMKSTLSSQPTPRRKTTEGETEEEAEGGQAEEKAEGEVKGRGRGQRSKARIRRRQRGVMHALEAVFNLWNYPPILRKMVGAGRPVARRGRGKGDKALGHSFVSTLCLFNGLIVMRDQKTVAFYTLGCKLNTYDTQGMPSSSQRGDTARCPLATWPMSRWSIRVP